MLEETVEYTDAPPEIAAPIARSVGIPDDFLPSPAMLAEMSKKEKITISLDRSTLDYFRREAERRGTKYQTMINNLLGSYVNSHTAR